MTKKRVDALNLLRKQITGDEGQDENLVLRKDEFMLKMLEEEKGAELLALLEKGEWKVCERMGLSKGYMKEDGSVWFNVPNWKSLVNHLTIVNSA